MKKKYKGSINNNYNKMINCLDTPRLEELDLVFVLDCTGSMGSVISEAQKKMKHMMTEFKLQFDTQIGLVEYRDHPPQERTFVTIIHPFTDNDELMKEYINACSASGGGDGAEAVTAGLYEALHMEWREKAIKICVLLADAPPHGIEPSGDGFPNGDPDDKDPLQIAREMRDKKILLYTLGCKGIESYKYARDFMVAVSEITGGQAISLENTTELTKIIIGAVGEESSLQIAETEISKLLPEGFNLMSADEQEKIISDITKSLISIETKQLQVKSLDSKYSHLFQQYPSLSEVKTNLQLLVPVHVPVHVPMRTHYHAERRTDDMDTDDIDDLDDTESIRSVGRGSSFPVGRGFYETIAPPADLLIRASISSQQVKRLVGRITTSSSHN